jgi:predicted metal-binding protein
MAQKGSYVCQQEKQSALFGRVKKRKEDASVKSVESFCKKAIEMGIEEAKIIDPGSVVTAEWVRLKCQYGCPGFGESLCCPPRTPTPDMTRKVLDSYQKAILLHQRLPKRKTRWARFANFSKSIVRLEIEIFLDGYYKAWSMKCGPCDLCKECNLSGTCKHGLEARPSMEACGIDVFKTARDNGFHIGVVRTRDDEMNIFGLVLVE